MIKQLVIFCLFTLLIAPLQANKAIAPLAILSVETVDTQQLIELIQTSNNLIIIDSRKKATYKKGHIEGSINIPDNKMTPEMLGQYVTEKTQALLFYCDSDKCARSSNAAKKARQWGYSHIYWYRDGWKMWLSEELPIEQ